LQKLECLNVARTDLTKDGVKRLREAMPRLKFLVSNFSEEVRPGDRERPQELEEGE